MSRRKILQREEPLIIEAYTVHDRTLPQIALFYSVSVGTIYNILKRNNIPTRHVGRKRADGTDIKEYKDKIKGE